MNDNFAKKGRCILKIRCTVCGAPNETEDGFDSAYCLTCGSQIVINDALAYRFPQETLDALDTEALVQLAKEAYHTHKINPDVLSLLKSASPSGDVEILYLLGLNHFNNKEYTKGIPYLYVAAEKMYPDALCLYAVSKYLQNPDDQTAYPQIRKYLTTARETYSKIFDKVDGNNLLAYINSVLDANAESDTPEKPTSIDAPTA